MTEPSTTPSAAHHLPDDRDDLALLRQAAQGCRGCPLFAPATQTVFGDGASDARLLVVGEQPGDREDIEGEPFVGPAGHLLDDAMEQAGIDRSAVYVTNVVKHFKFEERGKRRIHQRPDRDEIERCSPWLWAEIDAVDPELILALGATAAKSLFGSAFRVTKQRGQVTETADGRQAMATIHPSAVLRAGPRRRAEMDALVADLKLVADWLA